MQSTPSQRELHRKNVRLFLILALAALVVGLIPAFCKRYEQPQAYYQTRAELPDSGWLPALIPPSAREIHAQREPDTGQRWVRFAFDSTDMARVTAGARRLSPAEVKRLTPRSPTLSSWWQINPNTFQGKRAGRMPVYQVTGPDQGYVAIDPGNFVAFYWSSR